MISADAGSWVTTTKAATSIGPSTKTSSKSEVSAAIAARAQARAGRCRRRSGRSRRARIAAVSGGYVAPASAEAAKIQRQGRLAAPADQQQADQRERVQRPR